ncbi:hypothetical protein IWQ60_006912 [Tieghemiomyces parasiticus]|uniref:LIM zinc-binding domain-containing protein n=1 Tax=Tieghemiomyces parasiticus TaxID=78921 RepID=A0A9W8A1B1_9FUNG|nr:hypothetical protein IWQ60_006912 [Tieghemiomyces parasiticus]
MRFPSAPKCPRCQKSVYVAEQCHTRLDASRLLDREGEAYCQMCYNKLFGPRGFKLSGGTGEVSAAVSETRVASEIRSRSNSHAFTASPGLNRSPSVPLTPSRTPPTLSGPTFASWGYRQPGMATPEELPKVSAPASPTTPASADERRSPSPPASVAPSAAGPTPTLSVPLFGPRSVGSTSPGGIRLATGGRSAGTSYVPRKLNLAVHNDVCAKCRKTVYAAEAVSGVGKKYHRACFKCTECNCSLSASNLTENDNLPYCKRCHAKLFGPKGYGFAGGAAFLTPEGSVR